MAKVRPTDAPLPCRHASGTGPRRARAARRLLISPTFWSPAIAAIVLLSGCIGPEIDEMRRVEAGGGDSFTKALAEEYRDITLFEADEMYDWLAAGHFARKGLQAAGGESVEAEALDAWELPAEMVTEMAAARQRLLAAMQAGARAKLPELAAHAQGRFDCWIEQQEENRQPKHIDLCRDKFYAALAQLELAAAPAEPPAPVPEPRKIGDQPKFLAVLFFGFDSAAVSATAAATLETALVEAAAYGDAHFAVVGHTDSAGPSTYNDALAQRRALAVLERLVARGIEPERIRIFSRGELQPAVPTDSNTILQANRRVEILMIDPGSDLIGTNKPKHGPVPPILGLAPNLVTGSSQPTSARRRPDRGALRRRKPRSRRR